MSLQHIRALYLFKTILYHLSAPCLLVFPRYMCIAAERAICLLKPSHCPLTHHNHNESWSTVEYNLCIIL